MKSDTFRIINPLGKTFRLTIVFLFVFSGVAEWTTRQEFFQTPLTPPKMDSRHYQLGHKLDLLDTAVKKDGPVDCIMVGSSMVDVGFDPGVFQNAYLEISGRKIHCFNFGIDASSAFSAEILTQIVLDDNNPRFLIVGTDPRDYALTVDDPYVTAITDSSWIRYRLGNFTLDGWLTEISYLYRYRLHLSRLLRFNFKDTIWTETKLNFPIRPNGLTPITKISTYINDPPDPKDKSFETTYYTKLYSSYQILNNNIMALEKIMSYNGSETQVIIVEMPVSDGLYYFFGNGEADYNIFVARVSELADLHQVPFWRTEPLDLIPGDGWSDYSHLNVTGAEIFSTWLGEQVGRLEAQKDAGGLQP